LILANASRRGQDIDERGLSIEPRDQLEAMLAAQMAAVHVATMTFARHLAHAEEIVLVDSTERAFNKLTRTFAMQMEALKRCRSGAEQKVTLQHVSVAEGGQAIVGNVTQVRHKNGREKARRRRLRRPRRCAPIRMSCQCQAWTKARNTTLFQYGASQTNERRSQAQHRADAFQSLRPALAGPAGHHRSMARGAAACMGARWDQAPREATRTRLSMAAILARLSRNARIRELVRQARKLLLQIE
jgi:hypothetical protein